MLALTTPKNGQKSSVSRGLRMASKTIRKLTGHGHAESDYNPLPESLLVHLDMLHLMVECIVPDPETFEDGVRIHWLTDSCCIEYQGKGSPVFKNIWHIYQDGEQVAKLCSHTRDARRIKENMCKLELENHLFYSNWWAAIYQDLLQDLKAEMRNISQLHIAVDGCNHLYPFLNGYYKQNKMNAIIKKKGRARFDPKCINNDFLAQNFKIGSGHKYFSVYEKNQEIEKISNKEYIRKVWDLNGIDSTKEVWRCELRLSSQGVRGIKAIQVDDVDDNGEFKEVMPGDIKYIVDDDGQTQKTVYEREYIQGIDILSLMNPDYCLQIFKTECKNFFEFIVNTHDTNVSREHVIDLFGFDLRQIRILDKMKRPLARGFYKAKMAIHNAVSNVLLRHIRDAKHVEAALCHVMDNINLYDLTRFYKKKLPQWIEAYQPVRPDEDKFYTENRKILLDLVK